MAPYRFDQATERAIAEAYTSGASSTRLASAYGTDAGTVLRIVRRQGSQVRSLSRAKRKLTPQQDAEIADRYEQGAPARELANEHDVGPHAILDAVRRRGVPVRPRGHNGWKGGRRAPDSYGYIRVMVPADSPYASMRNGDGCVFEHRLVMAVHLGRPLTEVETVHHINGERSDNRLENLQLRVGHHGPGHSHECMECGSRNIRHLEL